MFWHTTQLGREIAKSLRERADEWTMDHYRIWHPGGLRFWIANGRFDFKSGHDPYAAGKSLPDVRLTWADKNLIWAEVAKGIAYAARCSLQIAQPISPSEASASAPATDDQ